MEKVSDMIWVGILAVLMGGCGLLGGGDRKPDAASSPAATPALAPKKTAAKSEPESEPEETVDPLPGVPRITPSTPDAIASGNGVTTGGEVPPRLEQIIFPTLPQMEPLPPIGRLSIAPARAKTATAVTVSGVMELGGERSAIVTAPDEPSRNVKVGDILASGAVLVKGIEINSGGLPVVILEEMGMRWQGFWEKNLHRKRNHSGSC
ncbi:MAG: hypothetical protein GDA48_09380 [Hormoscilla sp. GM102CHS1]|nr:hypothetical protein [Hormoscilla sp. GM102CHS1]